MKKEEETTQGWKKNAAYQLPALNIWLMPLSACILPAVIAWTTDNNRRTTTPGGEHKKKKDDDIIILLLFFFSSFK